MFLFCVEFFLGKAPAESGAIIGVWIAPANSFLFTLAPLCLSSNGEGKTFPVSAAVCRWGHCAFLWIPLGSLGFICHQLLQTLPLCFIALPPALTLILWSSFGCCWFSPHHVYILKFVGVFHHPVMLSFLDLISSCPIWSVWGLGYCEMMLLLPPSFQNASQWSYFNILKTVHKQVDGCNSCLSWGTERKA